MPSTSLVQQGATALLAAQPQNNQNTPAIISGDVCVGCIVWLPPKASYGNPPVLCNRLCCCGQAALEDRGYDHPVVVLKIRQRVNSSTIGDLVCTVACATTFSDAPLPVYIDRRLRRPHYQASIPIFQPNTDHPYIDDAVCVKMLVLEKGKLRKQSYVRLEHTYEVPVSMLTQYSGGRCRAYKKRLSNESYTILMENLGLASEVFEETATLFETTEGRLSKLANAARRSQNENLLLNRTENSQRLVFPTLNQHSPAQVSRSTPPTSRYGATSFTQSPEYLPLSYSHTQPYPSSPEDSGDDLASLDVKCFLGIVVIVVGSFVWWKYSR